MCTLQIDLTDYLDECIEALESENYLVFEDSSEIPHSIMISELNDYGYICLPERFTIFRQDDPKLDVKRQICDFLGISYHTKKEDILKLLGSKFRD